VDHLFCSAVKIYGAGTLALVMTGMGSDGLAGARNVHEAGGTVIAQDKATSVVWGMPGRVTQAGIADATLPLMELGYELTRRTRVGREVRPMSRPMRRFVDRPSVFEVGTGERVAAKGAANWLLI